MILYNFGFAIFVEGAFNTLFFVQMWALFKNNLGSTGLDEAFLEKVDFAMFKDPIFSEPDIMGPKTIYI